MAGLLRQTVALVRGLLVTGRYALRRPVTIQYPDEKTRVETRFKGRHWLTRYADGLERCVGCELCVIVCPSQAIYVRAAENTPERQVSKGERYAEEFQINMLRCIFCGFCEEACPTGAIVLGHEYELASSSREAMIYTKPMLTEPYPGASGRDPRRDV
ncbi:MAG: NADH-quinone oxidoreductase subunit NuoI [Armatimonadota bacterium]|nr:NADH-quinone oxidoreductase subunit NuoI [Armatimonadota bacterium]MDR7533186.1 NADH-quinone oxidoreductase subunit NuoI [Armatimonadota bacterium]MDR7535426.1 NADH-quinone oxidoreductase subunit NuoI [Armatimonadota bacterium]